MRELGLHILDIVENAIEAGAKDIRLDIVQDMDHNQLTITVQDDGRGMDQTTLKKVRDPFYTTRTTRHVGLGIPLFAAAAERCAGKLEIVSSPGQGTTIVATFEHDHIDRAPLGDMPSTLLGILMRGQAFDLYYRHTHIEHGQERSFVFDTNEIKQILDGVPLTYPDVREWLHAFLIQGEESVHCEQETR